MKKERFRNILKINGFIHSGNKWDRDDGYQIALIKENLNPYSVVDGQGNVRYSANIHELIGSLALDGIINRLF